MIIMCVTIFICTCMFVNLITCVLVQGDQHRQNFCDIRFDLQRNRKMLLTGFRYFITTFSSIFCSCVLYYIDGG